jgi:hypothetical protein
MPRHAHGLHELVDRTRRDALDIGLLNHRCERLLARTARLKEAGEVAALAQLRDLQVDRASTRLPEPFAVAIAAVGAFRTALSVGRRAQALRVELHEPLGHVLDHLAQQIAVGALLDEIGQCDSGLGGHRVVLGEVKVW